MGGGRPYEKKTGDPRNNQHKVVERVRGEEISGILSPTQYYEEETGRFRRRGSKERSKKIPERKRGDRIALILLSDIGQA